MHRVRLGNCFLCGAKFISNMEADGAPGPQVCYSAVVKPHGISVFLERVVLTIAK